LVDSDRSAAVIPGNAADAGAGGVIAGVRAALGVGYAGAVVRSARDAGAVTAFLARRTGAAAPPTAVIPAVMHRGAVRRAARPIETSLAGGTYIATRATIAVCV
jgi:hypothetical protein